ncbi:MAG: hypothetical protein L3J39_14750 [Verrucomicrobiales bacterium]|nr:hypothetical protein [Verrucomicrobiales bacterium]
MTYEDILQGSSRARNSSKAQAQVAGSIEKTAGVRLAVRVDRNNPDHHLWNNRGTWWCHFTLHKADYTAQRVRVSLKTRDQQEARERRDEVLAAIA